MRRGTNPVIKFNVGIDTSLIEDAYVTFEQGEIKVTKQMSECSCEAETINVQLTQAETLGFAVGAVKAQVRLKLTDGTIDASNIITLPVEPILYDGLLFEEETAANEVE